MPTCEFSWRCGGLSTHLSARPILEGLYRQRYCDSQWYECARYHLAVAGPLEIPDDLLPNQHDRLDDLTADASAHAEAAG